MTSKNSTAELALFATKEENEAALQLRREQRSLTLVPDLVALPITKDWAFAVKASFRAALDIQWTTLQKNKVKWQAWTQGKNYAFTQGDKFYDTPLGYEIWEVALQHLQSCLTVISARPATPSEGIDGEVKFLAQHPLPDKDTVCSGRMYQCTQAEFVELLRTGHLNGIHHPKL